MLNGKSHTCIHTKSILGHALSVRSIMKNSSFLLLYFFHLFLSFSFLYFFSVLHSLNLFFLCYILLFLHNFLHPRVSQVLGVFFLCPPSPLLEPSTLNCKAACLLFRHHLHINATRELAGQQVTVLPDICFSSSLSFI